MKKRPLVVTPTFILPMAKAGTAIYSYRRQFIGAIICPYHDAAKDDAYGLPIFGMNSYRLFTRDMSD